MIVIGLHGARGAGKDTVAARLAESWGFEILAHADPLRAAMLAMFSALGLDETYFEDRAAKETPTPALNGRSPRHALQTLGTEWGRHYMGEDIWSVVLARRIEMLKDVGCDRVVVTDVRFVTEARALMKLGAQVWLVYRPGSHFLHNHGSEFELPDSWITRSILNDRGVHELHERVDHLMEGLPR